MNNCKMTCPKLNHLEKKLIFFISFIVFGLTSCFGDSDEKYECFEQLNDTTYMKVAGTTYYGFLDITHHRTITLFDSRNQNQYSEFEPQWSETKEFYVLQKDLRVEEDTFNTLIFYNLDDNGSFPTGVRTDSYLPIADSLIRNRITDIRTFDSLATKHGSCE